MDKESLERAGPALDQFLEAFAGCAVRPTRSLIATYVRGQLGPLPRKSVKPMALDAGIPPRTLQELLSLHRWDEELLLDVLQRRVRREHPGGSAMGLLFETRCVKKGDCTPGVARQNCESAARRRNCVVFVHLGFSDGGFHCLLDTQVYLPRAWIEDQDRRRAAGIPEKVQYRSKEEIAAELIRRSEWNGHPLEWVLAPEEYLQDPASAEALRCGRRTVAPWPHDEVRSSNELLGLPARTGLEARRVLENGMKEIGLDHFEVRSYRSLRRHLALSAASLLFLAEQAGRSRRDREALPVLSRLTEHTRRSV